MNPDEEYNQLVAEAKAFNDLLDEQQAALADEEQYEAMNLIQAKRILAKAKAEHHRYTSDPLADIKKR